MEKELERKPSLEPLKTAKTALYAVILCAVIGVVCFVGGRFSNREPEVLPPDPIVLQSSLTEISELATVSYHYTNMAQFENSNDFYGVKIPFTTKRFILSYDGEIKAGIDLGQTVVSLNGNEVEVHLPASKILSHEMDPDSVQVFDEKTSIFNPLHVTEFAQFQADQQDVMEQKALDSGILAEAAEKARGSVRLLLEKSIPEGYTLILK